LIAGHAFIAAAIQPLLAPEILSSFRIRALEQSLQRAFSARLLSGCLSLKLTVDKNVTAETRSAVKHDQVSRRSPELH
jgi:hypothetical protein